MKRNELRISFFFKFISEVVVNRLMKARDEIWPKRSEKMQQKKKEKTKLPRCGQRSQQ